MLELAKNNNTEYKVYGENIYAVYEFKDLFEKITSVGIQDTDFVNSKTIRIGGVKCKATDNDAYLIKADESGIILSGNTIRGTLYAVYTFFERYAGCRYLTSDVEHIPSKQEFTIPYIDIEESPLFWYRETYYKDTFDVRFALRNKLNGVHTHLSDKHGGKIEYGLGFVHTFPAIIPAKEYFEKHPEYFPMIDGKRTTAEHHQICLSNPHVLAITIEKVKKAFRENPNVQIVSVSQNDTFEEGNQCRCDLCRAADEEEGSPSGSVIRFVNKVADAIKDEFPDKYIDTLAYRYTRKAPLKTKPRDNVIIRLCTIECCFSHALTECDEVLQSSKQRNSSFIDDIEAWSKISKNIFIWDYIVNFLNYLTPYPNIHTLQKNMQFFAEHNVKGVFSQGCGEMKYSCFAELRAYIITKLLEYPYCDIELHADEFMTGYYKCAAAPIKKYVKLLNEKAVKENFHFGLYDNPNRRFLTKEFLETADMLFDRAEKLADNSEILKRVRRTRLSIDYAKLFLHDGSLEERRKDLNIFFEKLRLYDIKMIYENGTIESGYERMKSIVTPEDCIKGDK